MDTIEPIEPSVDGKACDTEASTSRSLLRKHPRSARALVRIVAITVCMIAILLTLVVQFGPSIINRIDLNSSNPENVARARLTAQLNGDRATVNQQLLDQWTAQLSAKYLNLSWNGTIYSYQDIWADFARFQQQYPSSVVLVQGDQLRSLGYDKKWYVTLMIPGYSGEGQVSKYCSEQGFDTNTQCRPVKVTNKPFDWSMFITIIVGFLGLGISLLTWLLPGPKNGHYQENVLVEINQVVTERDDVDDS